MTGSITVTTNHDYSADQFTGVDQIIFATASASQATFAAKQFGPQISKSVQITGDSKADTLLVDLDTHHTSFSAAAWTFQSWNASSIVHIVGSAKADRITGPSVNAGFVTIEGGHGADILHGGTSSNYFDYHPGDAKAGEKVFGGASSDYIRVFATNPVAHYDFTHVAITAVESLLMNGASGGSVVSFTGKQVGAFGISSIGESNNTADTLIVKGNFVNLSSLFFTGWNNNQDVLRLQGTKGNDSLLGSSQNDQLIGGGGQDHMSGGAGADVFIFKSIGDTRPGAKHRDVINDFQHGTDHIDLSLIDANGSHSGHPAFNFVGTGALAAPGDLHYVDEGTFLLLEGTTHGHGKVDFQIEIHGAATLSAPDFV